MILRVTGTAYVLPDKREGEPQTKYYEPQENKEKIKQDFGLILDTEIDKLHIDILI